jgi:UDP-N-acetylmuramoyl-tripeptide--D-alanyl-D-alanine ligase
MEPIDLATVVRATQGRWVNGDSPRRGMVSGFSTDSRTIAPGQVFVALAGERFDGHDFLGEAAQRGATGFLVSEGKLTAGMRSRPEPVIAVGDTLDALEKVALWQRSRLRFRVTAVTGSVGKTTTKEFLRTLLSRRWRVAAAPKSFNNRLGVALTLLSADRDTDEMVLEMGTSALGEISLLSRAVRPERVVVTKVALAHLSGLGDLEGVAAAKREILDGLRPDGTAYLCADLEGFTRFAERAPGRVRTFGWKDGDFAVRSCESLGGGPREPPGFRFRLEHAGREEELLLRVPGRHNVVNAAAAAAVARDLGLSWEDVREGLLECRLPPGRLQVETIAGVTMVDDAYNANPASMAASIEAWESLDASSCRRRIAVLGDMLELGERSTALHEDLGRRLAQADVDLVVGVGPQSSHLLRSFRDERARSGSGAGPSEHFLEAVPALPFLQRHVLPGDSVLFKASHRIGLGELVVGLRRWLQEREAQDAEGGVPSGASIA